MTNLRYLKIIKCICITINHRLGINIGIVTHHFSTLGPAIDETKILSAGLKMNLVVYGLNIVTLGLPLLIIIGICSPQNWILIWRGV